MSLFRPFTLILCLPIACTASSDTTTTTGDASSSTGPGGSSSDSGSAASTSDDPSASTSADPTEHDTHTSHDASGTTSTTGPTTGHEATSHATHDPQTTSTTGPSGSTGSTGGGDPPPVADYCACMLVNCHDQYHATWGEDHEAAEAACTAAAEAVPSVGMPATDGDSLECRYHYCQLGHDDPGACESAIGGGACV
jgi:hypothetical protein